MHNTPTLPEVATFWVGESLDWLHQLCLASFVAQGHRVTLYHDAVAPEVPEGVQTRPAGEIWDHVAAGHQGAPASMLSDLFRAYLLKQTDAVWIDADVLCLRPLPDRPYHVGREFGGMVNGAVLRLPKDSATLNALIGWYEDPAWVPHWLGEGQQAKVAQAPKGQRLVAAFKLQRPSIGPRALRHTLKATGEDAHLVGPTVYYPVRGVFTDVLFNPFGGVLASITDKTLCIHTYASMIRGYHRRHIPHPDSFIANFAREIDFDIAAQSG